MKVKDWMTPDPVILEADQPIRVAVEQLVENHIRHMPVIRNSELVGILTDRDLKRALPSVIAGASPEEYRAFMERTLVSEVMTKNPLTCKPDTDLRDAVRIFLERKFGAIPVIENGRLAAILCQSDALRALASLLESDA